MKRFSISLTPCSQSPVIRAMHRQTKYFLAADMASAAAQVAAAFPGGADLTGEWFVELASLVEVTK